MDKELVETHISWVILTDQYAFKIKKPIKYSFLDFSSLERRHYFCEKEIQLNQRLASNMYLEVVPVTQDGKKRFRLGEKGGKVVDYAVKMNRLDNTKEMDLLLLKEQVTSTQIKKIAKIIASFHKQAIVIERDYPHQHFLDKFNDIKSISATVGQFLGESYQQLIINAVKASDQYLNANMEYMQYRFQEGFIRDGHGDLHSKNIFLYDQPVIFDCIEFNDELRYLDIIDEIAFFCMDLEANHRRRLADEFYSHYLELMGMEQDEKVNQLLAYYKGYRANIRAKVLALNLIQITNKKLKRFKIREIKAYLDLMADYILHLN